MEFVDLVLDRYDCRAPCVGRGAFFGGRLVRYVLAGIRNYYNIDCGVRYVVVVGGMNAFTKRLVI